LNGARAFGGEKLTADFENPCGASELAGQSKCRPEAAKIEGDYKSPIRS
jgi:hypothetical protein